MADKYEAIDLILEVRPDGERWADILFAYVTQDCQETEDVPCTCGLESMGAMSGTLEQCQAWSDNVGSGLSLIDLAHAIVAYTVPAPGEQPELLGRVVDWAKREIQAREGNW